MTSVSIIRYTQGWLLGHNGQSGALIPFELSVKESTSNQTIFSGPVGADLRLYFNQVISLCRLITKENRPLEFTLNFPLIKMEVEGTSSGLSFAYSLLHILKGLKIDPSLLAATGEVTHGGDIKSVDGFELKMKVAQENNFRYFLASVDQKEAKENVRRIGNIHHIMRLYS